MIRSPVNLFFLLHHVFPPGYGNYNGVALFVSKYPSGATRGMDTCCEESEIFRDLTNYKPKEKFRISLPRGEKGPKRKRTRELRQYFVTIFSGLWTLVTEKIRRFTIGHNINF